jgi:hypothetical protein
LNRPRVAQRVSPRHLRATIAFSLALLSCIAARGASGQAAASASLAHWAPLTRIEYVVDLSSQRRQGDIVALSNPPPSVRQQTPPASAGLWSARPGRSPARLGRSHLTPGGDEPYMVMSSAPPRGRCSFGEQTLYVLHLVGRTGVTAVDARGRVRQFATIRARGFESGIALDQTGDFGYRLLVTVNLGIESALYAVSCQGHVSRLVPHMQKIEGGIAVAPAGFGRFGGYLVGADEYSGHVYGFPRNGQGETLVTVGPAGTDLGVESVGFVPKGFGAGWTAMVADRVQPDYPPPGDGAILGIAGPQLTAEGVRPGDLLVVTEAGAQTFAVRCRDACRAWPVADGPATAHVEGHVVFMHGRSGRSR